MSAFVKAAVRQRAGNRCEYCQLNEEDTPLVPLQLEHIRPKKHGGSDDLSNLALACIDCNLHKGPNLTGIDPETDQIEVLFHPREQSWDDHFKWDGIHLLGKTAVGRTTVQTLSINSDDQLTLRSLL